MAAFMKIASIEGESTDKGHEKWIMLDSFQEAIHRTGAEGAVDQQRSRGTVRLSDFVLTRELDKSSVPLWQEVIKGKPLKEVEVHFCSKVDDKEQPYMTFKLTDVYITSYSASYTKYAETKPMESLVLNCTSVEKNYITIDPKDPSKTKNVPGKFDLGSGKT